MTTTTLPLFRVEVRPRPGVPDARAESLRARAASLGYPLSGARSARVYFIEATLSDAERRRIAESLLVDPVVEEYALGARPASKGDAHIEVHPLPGVMDPAAQSVRDAIRALLGRDASVSTGVRFDLSGVSADDARAIGERLVANKVIHRLTLDAYLPTALPHGSARDFTLTTAPLRGRDDASLEAFSREAHLFMSLAELRAVRDHYEALDRDPTDIELETIAQTWSEHCVHKTLKSTVHYVGPSAGDPIDWSQRPDGHETIATPQGHAVTIDNLLKRTVAAATHQLIDDGLDWTLSVFKDNSGVVRFDDRWGVNIKVETHNRPSAIEPYGGAATGAGGCIRDVIATGLGAKPIANTDIFCVALPDSWAQRPSHAAPPPPQGALHPARILREVVAGVRDYGNRMGIPTINGAVAFDDRYVGNPLVFCGCVGLIPASLAQGKVHEGDRIIALGGRTGRDGVHGATFSSAELEHTHADEFAHAVQIGNAIEEKRLLDAVLRARDATGGPLYSAMTDCGAGGFSSAIGEMAKDLGAQVHLDRAPLKYQGLSYTEIWISEAQERLVLAVPEQHLAPLREICDQEGVELADLGHFGTPDRTLDLFFQGTQVGQLTMEFLHEGLPMPTRKATWHAPVLRGSLPAAANATLARPVSDSLRTLLSHPDIASKHWIIRQYDHEVQGNTIVKPLVGPGGHGPGDASVLEPVPGAGPGIALACGLATGIGDPAIGGDPYHMALAAIDECVRNLVCVGGDPARTAILDNFCWPSCDKPEHMGALVRACQGCYDGAIAYRTPFVSGKDSLNNQFRYDDPAGGGKRLIEIPYTLLISGLARVKNVSRCVTMDAKQPGNLLVLIGATDGRLGGSHFQRLFAKGTRAVTDDTAWHIPTVDLRAGPAAARAVHNAIEAGLVRSAHDCSEGGMLCAVAEMLIATTGTAGSGEGGSGTGDSPLAQLLASKGPALRALGAELSAEDDLLELSQIAFAETPSRYLLEVRPEDLQRLRTLLRDEGGVTARTIGTLNNSGTLTWARADLREDVNDLARVWRAPLDW